MKSDSTADDLATWDVLVGRIIGDWDRANLKIKAFSESPGRFAAGARFCVVQNGERRVLQVRNSREIGHSWILDVGLNAPAEAAALKGLEMFVHTSMRPPLPVGEFYVTDMLGFQVRAQNGDELGEIEEILETPAHDVYVTKRAMIPAHDEFIVQRDWENRVLVVRDGGALRTDDEN